MAMNPFLLLLIVIPLTCLFLNHLSHGAAAMVKRRKGLQSKRKLPPGPRGIPILGCLPILGRLPHLTLQRWAAHFGPIIYLKLGQVPMVVASSPRSAELFLKAHDHTFASRPNTEYGRLVNYDFRGVSFSPYGDYWRNVRKICTLKLLSSLKVDSFLPMRRHELGLLIRSLRDAAGGHATVDLSREVMSLSRDITCRMVFGKKYDEEHLGKGGFKAVLEEIMYLAGAFNISEYIPWARRLDLQGIGRRMKAVAKAYDEFFEGVIDEHLSVGAGEEKRQPSDFVGFMLSFMESGDRDFLLDKTNLKAIVSDMLTAAIDTTPTTLQWALGELLRNPNVMKKAQRELESVVGLERMVEESDLAKLDYLDMVVKETMRLHAPVPLLLPHESMEDCIVDGFYIPRGSRVLVNAWAIGRDPIAWPNPCEFQPERFVGTHIDVKGRDFGLLPFGSGRRGCPAMQMGLTMVRLILAQLIHCFTWELPKNMHLDDLDKAEKFSLVLPPAKHILAIPTYRLMT